MGAVLSALGSAVQTIYMGLFGQPLLELRDASDSLMGEIRRNTRHVADLVNDIPGADWVTGLGSALDAVSRNVAAAQGIGDRFLTAAVRSGLLAFVWMLVGAIGLGAMEAVESS